MLGLESTGGPLVVGGAAVVPEPAAVAAFATILTLTYPLLAGDKLGSRLKAVADISR